MTSTSEATITEAGRKVAWKLNPAIGTTSEIERICSLIHRQAVTYDRIQEAWCNDEMSERRTARLEAKEDRIEARITDLVASLPATDDGPWRVTFQGDPRGYTVRILAPWHDASQNEGFGVYEGA